MVKDTITQDDPVKAIPDMKLAIKNTSVVLNMAITPGIILIPSDMIILKEKVAGYNNVLTLATKNMKFGVNKDINYVEPVETVGSDETSEDIKTTTNKEAVNHDLLERTPLPKSQPKRCFPKPITKPYTNSVVQLR